MSKSLTPTTIFPETIEPSTSSEDLKIEDTILVWCEIKGKADYYPATIIDTKEVCAKLLEKQYASEFSIF